MNARLLEKLIIYRQTQGLACAKTLLAQKIKYQCAVLGARKDSMVFVDQVKHASDIASLLLIEARAARLYWKKIGKKIQAKAVWFGRQAGRKDPVNQLLDIGYHYLTQKTINICQEINLPTELGIFHKAQGPKVHPLVYDFIEPWRPIMVDEVLLKVIGKKKQPIDTVDGKLIAYFIVRIKKKAEAHFFHKQLDYCITLDYWVRLLLLAFMSCVHLGKQYRPIFPSLRHESRCQKKPPREKPQRLQKNSNPP